MEQFEKIISSIDEFVWGPVMLVLLVGTGVFLTVRLGFAPWKNLGYAIKLTLSKESRQKGEGEGDISPFSALTTALAATIGTGNIVGVATAMVSGGPGALVWMWVSAAFGLSSKFSECMLAIKYRESNDKNEMSGGPMYTMKKAIKNKKAGAVMGWLFALFAVMASFGIGNLTQANSISDALSGTFSIPVSVSGIVLTVLSLAIIVGGIKAISKVSSVVVPLMAVLYILCGLVVMIGNWQTLPKGIAMIFQMAFSIKAVGGGLCGTITAAMMNGIRFGVARGVFSNEAGMGSAAITAAAATTNQPVKQGYVNMTGTFWDTIVVCTITGLCIAGSGVLGTTAVQASGNYAVNGSNIVITAKDVDDKDVSATYQYQIEKNQTILQNTAKEEETVLFEMEDGRLKEEDIGKDTLAGEWSDSEGNHYVFGENGSYERRELVKGARLTILAFESVLGKAGGWLISISIALFAFSTILGWEYHGEKAFEYLLNTHKYNMAYRILFSLIVYVGATTALDLVWNLSDIANALMAVPNLICLLALSGEVARDVKEFQRTAKTQH